MRRVDFLISMRRALLATAWVALAMCLTAVPAFATSAIFDPIFGFESTGIDTRQPGGTYSGELLAAGAPGSAPGLAVELENSTNVCILPGGSLDCQATTLGIDSAYTVLATVTVNVIDTTALPGEFTLVLSGLGPAYAKSDVTVNLDPGDVTGLDITGAPGFTFDHDHGVNGFTPFVVVEDDTFAGVGTTYWYVGWTVQDGDTVTFRYDVSVDPDGRAAPGLMANAIPVVIPEPGVAVLMGLGLAGLSAAGRRRG